MDWTLIISAIVYFAGWGICVLAFEHEVHPQRQRRGVASATPA